MSRGILLENFGKIPTVRGVGDCMTSSNSDVGKHFLAGAAAGGLADLIIHPVDTIRTRLQVQRKAPGTVLFKNTADAFSSTVRLEGWRALYKGAGIVLMGTIPAHALYFAGYEMVKSSLQANRSEAEKSPWVHFTAGLWAELCGACLWVPMDIVKQRLQAQRSQGIYKGSGDAIKTIYRSEGPKGFFKGYMAGLATYGPFVGFYFVFYEQSKRLFLRASPAGTTDLPFAAHLGIRPRDSLLRLVSGAVAGGVAAAVTCPMDVIKTRVQVDKTHTSAFDILKRTLREEGVRALGQGLTARILWIAPGTAITIALYEQFKRLLL